MATSPMMSPLGHTSPFADLDLHGVPRALRGPVGLVPETR